MIRLKQALIDPSSVFAEPKDVLLTNELTSEQKIKILKRWESEVREIQVAEEENMQGKTQIDLQLVLNALNTLGAHLDIEHTAPTKQGGEVFLMKECLFCSIIAHSEPAAIVHEDDEAIIFLDHRPLFHGHCLLIPKNHYPTLLDLPEKEVGPFFIKAKVLAQAVKEGMDAQGIFLGMNNTVSQSVPHLHVHVVPRTRGDGLKGFFWPRRRYQEDELITTQKKLQAILQKLMG